MHKKREKEEIINKKTNSSKILKGVIKITAKPLGFVTPVEAGSRASRGMGDDIIVFEENLNCALDKDEVEVEVIGKDPTSQKLRGASRKNGRVTKIV